MGKIKSKVRVLEYSKEFKVKIVELTYKLDAKAIDIADVFGLHPMMLYRWRQEYREGKLKYFPTRRVSMSLNQKSSPPPSKKELSENQRLLKQNERLRKENDLLKKWQRYLAEVRQKDSGS